MTYKELPDVEPRKTRGSSSISPEDVAAEAERQGVDPVLAVSVAKQESRGKTRAVSPKGAQGTMQLMPGTGAYVARKRGERYNPADAKQNVRLGVAYLKEQLDDFDGDYPKALSAYNAGPGRVRQAGGVPKIKETQDYVRKIRSGYEQIAANLPDVEDTPKTPARPVATTKTALTPAAEATPDAPDYGTGLPDIVLPVKKVKLPDVPGMSKPVNQQTGKPAGKPENRKIVSPSYQPGDAQEAAVLTRAKLVNAVGGLRKQAPAYGKALDGLQNEIEAAFADVQKAPGTADLSGVVQTLSTKLNGIVKTINTDQARRRQIQQRRLQQKGQAELPSPVISGPTTNQAQNPWLAKMDNLTAPNPAAVVAEQGIRSEQARKAGIDAEMRKPIKVAKPGAINIPSRAEMDATGQTLATMQEDRLRLGPRMRNGLIKTPNGSRTVDTLNTFATIPEEARLPIDKVPTADQLHRFGSAAMNAQNQQEFDRTLDQNRAVERRKEDVAEFKANSINSTLKALAELSPVGMVAKKTGFDYGNAVADKAARLLRGAADATLDIPEGVATLAGASVPKAKGEMTPQLREFINGMPARMRAGLMKDLGLDVAREWVGRNLQGDPSRTEGLEGFLGRTFQGAGSVVPFALGTVLTRGGSLSAAYLGALQNASSTYRDAKESGASDDAAFAAARIGALIGVSESIGLPQSLGRLGLSRPLIQRAMEVWQEGGQEALAQWLNNVNAAVLTAYDPQRGLSEGVLEAGLIGAIIGGGMQGLDMAASGHIYDSIKNKLTSTHANLPTTDLQAAAIDLSRQATANPEVQQAAAARSETQAKVEQLTQQITEDQKRWKRGEMPVNGNAPAQLQQAQVELAAAQQGLDAAVNTSIEPATKDISQLTPVAKLAALTSEQIKSGKTLTPIPENATVDQVKEIYRQRVQDFGTDSVAAAEAWAKVRELSPEVQLQAGKDRFYAMPEADAMLSRLGNEIGTSKGIKEIDAFIRKNKIVGLTAEDIAGDYLTKEQAEQDDLLAEYEKMGLPTEGVVQGGNVKAVPSLTEGKPDTGGRTINLEAELEAERQQIAATAEGKRQADQKEQAMLAELEQRATEKAAAKATADAQEKIRIAELEKAEKEAQKIQAKEQEVQRAKDEKLAVQTESQALVNDHRQRYTDALASNDYTTAARSLKQIEAQMKFQLREKPATPAEAASYAEREADLEDVQKELQRLQKLQQTDADNGKATRPTGPLFSDMANDPEYRAQQKRMDHVEADRIWMNLAEESRNRALTDEEKLALKSPIEYIKHATMREGIKVGASGERALLGAKESGIVGLTNQNSKFSTSDAQVMLDEGGFTLPDGRRFTDPSVTENDVVDYLINHGKSATSEAANLDARLAAEEDAYYQQQNAKQSANAGNSLDNENARNESVSQDRAAARAGAGTQAETSGQSTSEHVTDTAEEPALDRPAPTDADLEAMAHREEEAGRLPIESREEARQVLGDTAYNEYSERIDNANEDFDRLTDRIARGFETPQVERQFFAVAKQAGFTFHEAQEIIRVARKISRRSQESAKRAKEGMDSRRARGRRAEWAAENQRLTQTYGGAFVNDAGYEANVRIFSRTGRNQVVVELTDAAGDVFDRFTTSEHYLEAGLLGRMGLDSIGRGRIGLSGFERMNDLQLRRAVGELNQLLYHGYEEIRAAQAAGDIGRVAELETRQRDLREYLNEGQLQWDRRGMLPRIQEPSAKLRDPEWMALTSAERRAENQRLAREWAAKVDDAAHEAATSPLNDRPLPSEAQISAGNYKVGPVRLHGLEISIENPKGSTRSGVDAAGTPWAVTMENHYGYIKGKDNIGADGEHLDVYIGDHPQSERVFVVDQVDSQTGKFDEHKVILNAADRAQAEQLYDAHFSDGKGADRRGAITEMSLAEFRDWLKTSDTTKPVADLRANEKAEQGQQVKPDLAAKSSLLANSETPAAASQQPVTDHLLLTTDYRLPTTDQSTSQQAANAPLIKPEAPLPKATATRDRSLSELLGELERGKKTFTLTDNERTQVEARRAKYVAANDPKLSGDIAKLDQLLLTEPAAGKEPMGIIADFGVKIGGARKDTARSLGKRAAPKEVDERHAWLRKYNVSQITKSLRPSEEGKFGITRDGEIASRQVFDTREAAEAAIPLFEVARKHRVTRISRQGEAENWAIYRKVADRKFPVVKDGFLSEEAAKQFMAQHPEEIINYKFPEPERPWLDSITRTGEPRREGNIIPRQFQEDFDFRGGEFGNWNKGGDGQEALNYAYDAMHDLAEVLGVPPKALSLGGQLSIAFGARGHGGKDAAAAHYEPKRAVINLTKIKGAGSLAHEWFHALDHYVAMVDGKTSAERQPDGTFKIAKSYMATHGFQWKSQAQKELVNAFDEVVRAMTKKKVERAIDASPQQQIADRQAQYVKEALDELRRQYITKRYSSERFKVPTEEQIKQWDELSAKIIAGEVGDRVPVKSKADWGYDSHPEIIALDELYKQAHGRGLLRADVSSPGRTLNARVREMLNSRERLGQAQKGATEVKTVGTDFYNNARTLDQTRVGDYFTTPHEMGARAFEAYVYDKIEEQGKQSDYLVSGVENKYYFGNKPYPEGAERIAINQAFDRLFEAVRVANKESGFLAKAAAEARQRLTDTLKGKQINDVTQVVGDLAIVGAEYLYRGIQKGSVWAKALLKEFGQQVKPYLQQAWVEAKKFYKDERGILNLQQLQKLLTRQSRAGIPITFDPVEFSNKVLTAINGIAHLKPAKKQAALDAYNAAMVAVAANDGAGLIAAQIELKKSLGKFGIGLLDVTRPMMAGGELSIIGRQGGYHFFSHPILSSQALLTGFQSVSEKGYHQTLAEMEAHPYFEKAKKAGVDFGATSEYELGKSTLAGEENFSVGIAGKIPGLKHLESINKGFLDTQRLKVFEYGAKQIEKAGGAPEEIAAGLKEWAKEVNRASGRGNISEKYQGAVNVASMGLFSPRFAISRLQLMDPTRFIRAYRKNPAAAKLMLADGMKIMGAIAALAALAYMSGASVGDDPDDADFLKVKSGNVHFSLLPFGLSSYVRYGARMAKRAVNYYQTGDKAEIDKAQDQTMRFGRMKLAPLPGLVVDRLDQEREKGQVDTIGHDAIGQPKTLRQSITDRLWPMFYQNVAETAMKEGLFTSLKKTAPEFFGADLQVYDQKERIGRGADSPYDKKILSAPEKRAARKDTFDRLSQTELYKQLPEAYRDELMERQMADAITDAERRKEKKSTASATFKRLALQSDARVVAGLQKLHELPDIKPMNYQQKRAAERAYFDSLQHLRGTRSSERAEESLPELPDPSELREATRAAIKAAKMINPK